MYGDVAVAVISYSMIQISPESFSRVVNGVKLLRETAVDGTKRICLEIWCMIYQRVQDIRIVGVNYCILTHFIYVTSWAVFGSNKINCNLRKSLQGLCFIFNGSLWKAKEWGS